MDKSAQGCSDTPEHFKKIVQPLGERSPEYFVQLQGMCDMLRRIRATETTYGECYQMVTALEEKIRTLTKSS